MTCTQQCQNIYCVCGVCQTIIEQLPLPRGQLDRNATNRVVDASFTGPRGV